MSVKAHKEVIDNLNSEIGDLKIKIKTCEEALSIVVANENRFRDLLAIEVKANSNSQVEHQKLCIEFAKVNTQCRELQVEIKAKMDMITRLYDAIRQKDLAIKDYRDLVSDLRVRLDIKKTKKKWYKFF